MLRRSFQVLIDFILIQFKFIINISYVALTRLFSTGIQIFHLLLWRIRDSNPNRLSRCRPRSLQIFFHIFVKILFLLAGRFCKLLILLFVVIVKFQVDLVIGKVARLYWGLLIKVINNYVWVSVVLLYSHMFFNHRIHILNVQVVLG